MGTLAAAIHATVYRGGISEQNVVLDAPLKTSLFFNPQAYNKGVLVTNEAGTAESSVKDFEGIYRYAAPYEAKFHGARRVQNMLLDSTVLHDELPPSWYKSADSADLTLLSTSFGVENGVSYIEYRWINNGTINSYPGIYFLTYADQRHKCSLLRPRAWIGSCWIGVQVVSGSSTGFVLELKHRRADNSQAPELVGHKATLPITNPSPSMTRYCTKPYTVASGSTGTYVQMSVQGTITPGTEVIVRVGNAQLEQLEGASNTSASEFVSVNEGQSNLVSQITSDAWWTTKDTGTSASADGKTLYFSGTAPASIYRSLAENVIHSRYMKVRFTVSNRTGDAQVRPRFNFTTTLGTWRTANGTYIDYIPIVVSLADSAMAFQFNATVASTINVEIHELSFVDHGAIAKGVKYFDTTSGNSVDANNVVTAGAGSPIANSTMLGFVMEDQRVELAHGGSLTNILTGAQSSTTNIADGINVDCPVASGFSCSFEVIGTGIENGYPYIDIRFNATNTSGSTVYPEIKFRHSGVNVTVTTGDLISTKLTGMWVSGTLGGNVYIGATQNASPWWIGTTQNLAGGMGTTYTYTANAFSVPAGVTLTRLAAQITVPNGATYTNAVFRFWNWSMQKGESFLHPSIIPATTGDVTRTQDVISYSTNMSVVDEGAIKLQTSYLADGNLNPDTFARIIDMTGGTTNCLYAGPTTGGCGYSASTGSASLTPGRWAENERRTIKAMFSEAGNYARMSMGVNGAAQTLSASSVYVNTDSADKCNLGDSDDFVCFRDFKVWNKTKDDAWLGVWP